MSVGMLFGPDDLLLSKERLQERLCVATVNVGTLRGRASEVVELHQGSSQH